ncbi:MAG: hypothetical protein Q7K03_10665 [Dehalococcoidia bacterium]|nr:hypothetical protein [Dehalococcoidia bacterium]
MARSRNIKPGFFKNERLADTGMDGRLLFAGLWTLADRDGRMEDRPRYIKVEIFPYDDGVDIEGLLDSLHDGGFIQRYEAEGERYICVTKWDKHQNPHMKEAVSIIPPPPEHYTSTMLELCETTTSTEVAVLIPDSLNLIPDSAANASESSAEIAIKKNPKSPKLPDEDPYAYAQAIAEAAGYERYTNKGEACKQAKDAIKQNLFCDELAGCVRYMLETNGGFWVTQTLTIASAMRQWPAYQKAVKNGWKPGDGAPQRGNNNGKQSRRQTPDTTKADPYADLRQYARVGADAAK